jgi:two-component system, OmpR family, response regulator QseB
MRLLLVEDDPMIGESVQLGLTQDGYAVDWVKDGQSAELAMVTENYDLLLLDLGLPKKDGLQLLRNLRAGKATLPVLIITARDGIADRVKGLDAGADDYLVKPFNLDELTARIRALLRRHAGRAEAILTHGALSLNPARHEVMLSDRLLRLSAREEAILHALLERPGIPLSRAQLEQRVYSWKDDLESNAVEVHIYALRRKLGAEWIQNLRGVGYLVPKTPPV